MSRTLSVFKKLSPVSSKREEKKDPSTGEEKQLAERATKYPRGIPYILGTEFVERFSFYCFQGILTLYMTQELNFSGYWAASIFHTFMVLAYISPVFGALIADGWLGLFRTIFYLSILFAIGNSVVAIGATPMSVQNMTIVSLFGLFIVALGTGGIKPCVSAFGGSQFDENQIKERHQFFSLFFFAINIGSILSTIISPELRASVHCFGKDTCYPLAFGAPALLSIIVITLFICGKSVYKIRPAEGSEFVSVFRCIFYALAQKFRNKRKEKRNHWLEYADDKFDRQLIFDIKSFLQVTWMYIPLPIYWALYEQQGSTWILQSAEMDGEVGGYQIKPDQMQIINPIFILIFIPLFNSVIYPFLRKCGLCKMPLQRMAVGGILVAIAFVMTGFIQLKIEQELPEDPLKGNSELTIINNSPCNLHLKDMNTSVTAFTAEVLKDIPSNTEIEWEVLPSECSTANRTYAKFGLQAPFMSMGVALSDDTINILIEEDEKIKERNGYPRVKLHFSIDYVFKERVNASFLFDGAGKYFVYPDKIKRPSKVGSTEYCVMKPGLYKIYIPLNGTTHKENPIGVAEFRDGGSYVVAIHQNSAQNASRVTVFMTVLFNSVHMLYQLPQIILLTAGEIMFEVTGLDFSYCESPDSLKSLVQGMWFFTNGIGNAFFIIIEGISTLEKQSHEFFMYSIIMAITTPEIKLPTNQDHKLNGEILSKRLPPWRL
ncbi:peptide transporter family 2-like [Argiope bruennichi]|uniref:peptide transporter family 2-like n=1 Tax=Argiope bruennichi TaxID=94029 RepID=UPI002493D291|nr:peptide transporter family 2-like [Argiope bruennichi]